jgi:UDP-N-acetylmuramoyl-L-alanyl-D-glutamate--2,6-diaminopimelate ligase
MGKTAAELADIVIVTDDDPRHEDPAVIRHGLLDGARSVDPSRVHEIPDPSEAIRWAISLVGEGDTVLWTGPGSQDYRDIAGVKVPYSARTDARAALAEAGWSDSQ